MLQKHHVFATCNFQALCRHDPETSSTVPADPGILPGELLRVPGESCRVLAGLCLIASHIVIWLGCDERKVSLQHPVLQHTVKYCMFWGCCCRVTYVFSLVGSLQVVLSLLALEKDPVTWLLSVGIHAQFVPH